MIGLKRKMAAEFTILNSLVNMAGFQNIEKKTDKDAITLRFWQEIYEQKRNLREIHEKDPVDNGS